MTTKGIAVISGSNTVVARIMDDGTAIFGENKPINLKISGNLVLDLSGSAGTSGYLFINSSGSSSLLAISVSASQVSVVPSGNLSSNNVQSAFYELQDNINTLSASLGITAGTGIVINGNVVSASNVPNSSLQNSSINLNGVSLSLGGTGSVGIIREIQAGNSITVTNGSSSIATIALSNTVNGITNLSAVNISSSNFTGNGSNITNINTSNINNFTIDVRNQFAEGTGIQINGGGGTINVSNAPNSSLQNSSINLNGVSLSLGSTGSVGITREIQAGANIAIANGTSDTATVSLSSSLTGLGSISATTITASVISASSYLGITAGATPGGVNTSIQYNSGSTLSGSSNFIYDYNTNTLSGTTAQFTTITASMITIGAAEDADYTDGLFTSFTPLTPIGLVVDKFNEVLKGLAPPPAPTLSNLERNAGGGNNMILSFGATSPTASYTSVTASLAGLANVDIGGTYSVINGPGAAPIRLGIFTALTALTSTLNNNTTANAGAFTNYPAKAYNVSSDGIGSYLLEVNDLIVSPSGSTISTASYNANQFNLSLANTASFTGTGQAFDLFRHRTGTMSIPTALWRNGHNYAKVTQVSSLGTSVTNYIDWVYDPQAASGASTYAFTTTSSSFTVGGIKALSGIKYYQTCSFNFTSSVSNYYKNSYSTAANGGITFGSLTTGLAATAFASTPAPTNSNNTLQRSSLHTLTGVRVLGSTLTSTMTVANGLGKTGTSVLTTPTILFDNINTANTNVLENFCFEDFRVISASYDTQIQLTGAPAYTSGSDLSAGELAVYNGGTLYPTQVINNGNVAGSGITYILASQPNYSGSVDNRFYLRKFVNGASALATFNLILTGSNINFTAFGGALTTNNVKITVKVPGKTGWRDVMTSAPPNTTGIALNDNVGCLAGAAPTNITTAAGRSISINLLTEAVGASENYIVRILASKDWTGNLTRIQIA